MDVNVGALDYLIVIALGLIVGQLWAIILWLRQICGVLTIIRRQADLITWWGTVKEPHSSEFLSPDPHHLPGSPFSRTDR